MLYLFKTLIISDVGILCESETSLKFKRDILALHLLQKMRKMLQDDGEGSAIHGKVIILLLCVLLQVYRHLQEDRGQARLSLITNN